MLTLLKKSDDEAWLEQVVDEHKDRLYTFARYMLDDAEAAADVTQDVLLRLWDHRHRVDRERAGAWLNRVCRNACLDALRQRKVRDRIEPLSHSVSLLDEPLPDDDASARQLRELVLEILEELGEPYRTLVILRDIQDLAYADIAEAVELPLNTVKVYLHRARRRLRDALPEEIRPQTV